MVTSALRSRGLGTFSSQPGSATRRHSGARTTNTQQSLIGAVPQVLLLAPHSPPCIDFCAQALQNKPTISSFKAFRPHTSHAAPRTFFIHRGIFCSSTSSSSYRTKPASADLRPTGVRCLRKMHSRRSPFRRRSLAILVAKKSRVTRHSGGEY